MASSRSKSRKNKSKSSDSQSSTYITHKTTETNSPLKQLYETDMIYYHLFVNDFPKMKSFYQNILEFDLAGEAPPEFGWCDLYLPVKGARIGLFKTDKKLENINAAPSLNVPVKDLEIAYQQLKAKSIEVSEIIDIPTQISMFDFRDPEGNRISFVSSPRIKG